MADGGADKEPEIVDESDGDDDVPEDAYDVLESALSGEYGPSTAHREHVAVRQERRQERPARRPQSCEYRPMSRHARATEQVLDPRTRLILFKLLQRNAFAKLEGCLSTGKEANVLLCFVGDGLRDIEATKDVPSNAPLAVKVYKTPILVFAIGDGMWTASTASRRATRPVKTRGDGAIVVQFVGGKSFKRRRRDSCPQTRSGVVSLSTLSRFGHRRRVRARARRPSAEASAAEGPRPGHGVHRECGLAGRDSTTPHFRTDEMEATYKPASLYGPCFLDAN